MVIPLCKRNKPINDNIHESFTYRLRGEIQDETKDYLVEDHNESSLGAYFGTPVNLMILEKENITAVGYLMIILCVVPITMREN